jgi:hypothetical protein
MSVPEIEAAIRQLPLKELVELSKWLRDYQEQMWDRQIEGDLVTGRLDALLAEVDKEYGAGAARPL